MKIVIDDKIPYIKGAFEGVAEVVYCAGAATTPKMVQDADVLITRTRTACNEELLRGSSVQFIATATIGYDHIDTEFCRKNNIHWTNAPGCNSKSVEQYVASALMLIAQRKKLNLCNMTLGVVGVGNVGSKIALLGELLGMNVLLNDPPRERAEQSNLFVDIDTILNECDIISLHVPLEYKGEFSTFHMFNEKLVNKLQKKIILINSCRGEVIETEVIKKAIYSGKISSFVCDCWENEPTIDLELLNQTEIATPHIAGYSKDGKAMGTLMSVRAINNFFDLGMNNWSPLGVELPLNPIIEIDGEGLSDQEVFSQAILHTYDISNDDEMFRSNPQLFEQLRGEYGVRREFSAFKIKSRNVDAKLKSKLEDLGFNVL